MSSATLAATSSNGDFSEDEQSQLRINIKKFTINYKQSNGKEIVFSPSMLELGETEYALGSGSSGSSSSVGSTRLTQSVRQERSAIYLPDTHKIRPIFTTYYKKYSPTIGNPALVFIDKATFLDYMKYATRLISDERKKNLSVSPPGGPVKPSIYIDTDKVRQINDNIKFVIETIFSKNRVLTVGGDFKVQVMVGGRKVLLNQEYYIESLPTIPDKSTPLSSDPIYTSADSKVFELEEEADKKKLDIKKKEQIRKVKEEKLQEAYKAKTDAVAKAASTGTTMTSAALQMLNDDISNARTEYKKAREEEKVAISERSVILNKINQFKYGRENPKISDILSKISSLKREQVAKELEIDKIKLSIEKVMHEISKKEDEIKHTDDIINKEIGNAAKIYEITTGVKSTDTILAEITAAYTSNANRIRAIEHSGIKQPEEKAEHDKKLLQNSQYDIIAKTIKKMKEKLKEYKAMIDIGGSSSSLLTKKKELENNITSLNVDKEKKTKEIDKLNLSLYDYTLRVYIFDMPQLSLVSKYLENGKENPQFTSMHKKFYKSVEADELALSRVGSKQTFLSTVNCAKDRNEIGKMYDNIMGSTRRTIEDAIDGIGIQDGGGGGGGGGAMDKIKAALMHAADVYVDDDPGESDDGWTAKILKKAGEDETSKYISKVEMGSYPLYFALFGLYRMHKPVVEPPTKDTIDVACDKPPPDRHSQFTVDNLNLILSEERPVPEMFPPQSFDMSEYSKRIKDVRIPYENYNFNNVN